MFSLAVQKGVTIDELKLLDIFFLPHFNAPYNYITVAALKAVKWFLDCGDDDFLLPQSESLHQKMKARGIKCELRVRDGAHRWEYWHSALTTALPFASRNFER